ncbi:hypothetical protein [Natrinema sp. CGMCC1.2065]|uniref:hypothetical protein n=1 Tax=Natrinema sp. CGMCC1.2065 TaxID=3445767 RepID=UPI003F49BF47
MILSLYLVLLVIGAVGTALVIAAGTKGTIGGIRVDRRTGIVISAFIFVLWGLVAVSSFEIVVYSGGTSETVSYPQVAWVAVVGGATALLSMFQAAIEEIQETGGI